MSEFLLTVLAYLPYFAVALGLGFALVLAAPWLLRQPERWLLYAVVLFSLPAFMAGDAGEGNVTRQIAWGTLFAIAALHLGALNAGRISFSRSDFPPLFLTILLFYALVTVLWSASLAVSARRWVQLFGVVLVALALARHAAGEVGLRTRLLGPVTLFLGIGLLAALLTPQTAFDGNALQGIASHKNTWGQFSLLACVVILFSIPRTGRRRWLMMALLGCAITSLALSRSATSLLTFFIVALLFLILVLNSFGVRGQLGLFAILTGSLSLATIYTVLAGDLPVSWLRETLFSATGKNQTLTGRAFLWELMFAEIERHRWWGIGYGGFWMGLSGPSAALIARLNWGPPTQAHSGYIDIINELGIVGIGLFALMLLFHVRTLFKVSRFSGKEAGFHSAILLSALILNYAESSFLRTTQFWWVVLCISMVEMHARARAGERKEA